MNASRHRLRRAAAPTARRGFTLVELLAGLLSASALVLGLASVVLVATQAVRPPTGSAHLAADSAEAAADLTAELHFAHTVTETTPTAVTFVVGDRDGDGGDETIRYQWSGTGGDPLTRQYNGAAAATVATDVHRFALAYRAADRVEDGTTRRVLTWVGVRVQLGPDGRGEAQAATEPLNRPEVSGL
jgi:hypothetical protein